MFVLTTWPHTSSSIGQQNLEAKFFENYPS